MKSVALVLGASSDIGYQICLRHLQDGDRVIFHYNSGSSRFDELRTLYGNQVRGFALDLSDLNLVDSFVRECGESLDDVTSIYYAVGAIKQASITNLNLKDFWPNLSVNGYSVLPFIQHLLPKMREEGEGRLVLLSSIGVRYGGSEHGLTYSLGKCALDFLPAYMRRYAKDGVLCNSVHVGFTNTKFHDQGVSKNFDERIRLIPLGRPAEIGEIADFCYYLGSTKNTYVTGETLAIGGGE